MSRVAHATAGPSRWWVSRCSAEAPMRVASSSRSVVRRPDGRTEAQRYFASTSRTNANFSPDETEPQSVRSSHYADSSSTADRQSIYPDSKAAQRRRPHQRSSLFQTRLILRRPDVQGTAIKRGEDDDPAALAASLSASKGGEPAATTLSKSVAGKQKSSARAEKVPYRSDANLRHLLARLTTVSTSRHAKRSFEMLRIAECIKERLAELHQDAVSAAQSRGEAPPSLPAMPKSAYVLLLETLGAQLRAKECELIIGDMRLHNVDIDIDCLHHLLLAAVCQGDIELIHSTLANIADLPYKGSEKSVSKKSSKVPEPLLSHEWTRNWTVGTYAIMFLRCKLSHDLEQCLALLASAAQHKGASTPSPSPKSTTATSTPFLTEVLNPSIVSAIISTAASVREPRLTADLAVWFDEHVGRRQVPVSVWYMVLRVCAEHDWYPGMVLAWDRCIIRNSLSCDEGLVQSILQCASRAGEADFITEALAIFQRRSAVSAPFVMQEWHLVPLLDAQCSRYDFTGAIRTTSEMIRIVGFGGKDSRVEKNFLALRQAAGSSEAMLERAADAAVQVGRDTGPGGGINIRVLNTLLRSANHLRRLDIAYRLYRARHYLRSDSAPKGCTLPALPQALASSQLTVDEDLIDDSRDVADLASSSQLSPRANVETYNELLSAAIYRQSRRLAKAVMAQLLAARVPANATTYERAIVLALTQPRYEAAFGYLEECKARKMQPTPATYAAMASRCLAEDDNRWVALAHDMRSYDYRLPVAIHHAMLEAGHLTDADGGSDTSMSLQNALRPRGYKSPFPSATYRAHRP